MENEVNAERVWIQGVTGCNVTIAVVDGGNGFRTHAYSYSNSMIYSLYQTKFCVLCCL